ncbi:MAG: hypothetical protein H5T65_00320 [Chloroflexi bacterium]|nr:hypothetical protein [Chloroflexota bacterium]
MAKPTKHAGTLCVILGIIALAGIVLGLLRSSPLITILLLIPTAVYEVYRTEGASTRWASWVLLLVLIAEVFLVALGIHFDLAGFLGEEERYVAGYEVPIGDITVVGPAILAVLSLILIARTRGRYTKSLAAIILVTSFAIVYAIDPTVFARWIRLALDQGLNLIR